MKRNFIACLLVMTFFIFPQQTVFADITTPVTETQSLSALGDETAKLLTEQYNVDSVQYALIKDGQIILSGGAGWQDKEKQTPVATNTLYGIGSISKIFTTVAVMQLVDAGLVQLDKPVTTYIPEFTMADERYKNITVRMLLNHSSGLMGSSLNNAFLYDDNDTINHDTFLQTLKQQRLKADPGAYSVYCNDGFTLAEILVEKVSGLTFSNYLRQKITFPLRLNNTLTPQDELPVERMAKYYQTTVVPQDTVNIIGTGGIYSTAEDLCHFAQIFMAKPYTINTILTTQSAQLTSKPSYNQILWPDGNDDNLSYGLGWDRTKGQNFLPYAIALIGKGGDTLLSHGYLTVLPEHNMAVAVLSSGGNSVYAQMFAEKLLLTALVQSGELPSDALNSDKEKALLARVQQLTVEPESAITAPLSVMPEEMMQYSGYYGNFGGVMRVDITHDGQLLITIPNRSDYSESYVYNRDGIFTDSTGLVSIKFTQEENGKTYLQLEGPSFLYGLGIGQSSQYNGQKLEAQPVAEAVQRIWQERNGKSYYVVNEKYSSQLYAQPFYTISLIDELSGYVGSSLIENASKTKSVLQIPGVYGRDLKELTFITKNGVEYLNDGNNLFISEDSFSYLSDDTIVTIANDGYAQWYHLDESISNRTITVNAPENSTFVIYDADGNCLFNRYVAKTNTTILPEKGYIVFVGDAKTVFTITLS